MGHNKMRRRRSWQSRPGIEGLERRALLATGPSVLTYHNDSAGTGANLAETTLTSSGLSTSNFGKLFSTSLDGYAFAQPLYVPGVNITTGSNQGIHNVVYVATEHDSLYAFDADNGTLLWKDSLLRPIHGGSVSTVPTILLFNNVLGPEEGITGTPVVDASTGTIYVVAQTQETIGGALHFVQQLHAIDLGSGAEKLGGPAVIAETIFDGTNYTFVSGPTVVGIGGGNVSGVVTYNALRQNQRVALAENNGTIYVASSSMGETHGHGWILGYNATSLALTSVFNATPNGESGGIWVGGGEIAFDPAGNLYVTVGDGTFDGSNGSNPAVNSGGLGPITGLNAQGFPVLGDYGDSVLKLSLDPTTTAARPGINGWGIKVADYFTPNNQAYLFQADADLGSQGVVLLPASAGSAAHPNLLEDAGKEGRVYLLDMSNLGKFGTTSDNAVAEIVNGLPGGSYTTPAYANGAIYSVSNNGHAQRFVVSNATITVDPHQSPDAYGYEGASPSISSNGTSGGIVWTLDQGTNTLRAYDASNLSNELYTSAQGPNGRDTLPGAVSRFSTPTIINGKVYVATTTGLAAYGVLTGPVLPFHPNGAPFGVHNPDVQTAEVTGLYNTILGRAPDTAGLTASVAALKAGTPLTQLAGNLLNSVEYENGVVAYYYQTFLNRTASASEIAAWMALLQGGVTEEQAVAAFLDSAEFSIIHLDNVSFVGALYADILGRQGSGAEITAAAGYLTAGNSRSSLVAFLLGSTEANTRAAEALYEVFLARPGDPSGISAAVSAFQNGLTQAQLAALLAGSAEFTARAGGAVG
jgi:hypothetical protein